MMSNPPSTQPAVAATGAPPVAAVANEADPFLASLEACQSVYDENMYYACREYVMLHELHYKKYRRDFSREMIEKNPPHLQLSKSTWLLMRYENPFASRSGVCFFAVQTMLAIASVASLCFESMPSYNGDVFPVYTHFWPLLDVPIASILLLDLLVFWFLLPDTPNIYSSGLSRGNFVFQARFWIDLMATVPSFLTFLDKFWSAFGKLGPLKVLRVLRFLRALRVLHSVDILLHTLERSVAPLLAPFALFVGITLLFGTALFYVESGDYDPGSGLFLTHDCDCEMSTQYLLATDDASRSAVCPLQASTFVSILHSMWYVVVTLATVGYGDMVPRCGVGRFLGAICMFFGGVVIAMPIAIVGMYYTGCVLADSANQRSDPSQAFGRQKKPLHITVGADESEGGTEAQPAADTMERRRSRRGRSTEMGTDSSSTSSSESDTARNAAGNSWPRDVDAVTDGSISKRPDTTPLHSATARDEMHRLRAEASGGLRRKSKRGWSRTAAEQLLWTLCEDLFNSETSATLSAVLRHQASNGDHAASRSRAEGGEHYPFHSDIKALSGLRLLAELGGAPAVAERLKLPLLANTDPQLVSKLNQSLVRLFGSFCRDNLRSTSRVTRLLGQLRALKSSSIGLEPIHHHPQHKGGGSMEVNRTASFSTSPLAQFPTRRVMLNTVYFVALGRDVTSETSRRRTLLRRGIRDRVAAHAATLTSFSGGGSTTASPHSINAEAAARQRASEIELRNGTWLPGGDEIRRLTTLCAPPWQCPEVGICPAEWAVMAVRPPALKAAVCGDGGGSVWLVPSIPRVLANDEPLPQRHWKRLLPGDVLRLPRQITSKVDDDVSKRLALSDDGVTYELVEVEPTGRSNGGASELASSSGGGERSRHHHDIDQSLLLLLPLSTDEAGNALDSSSSYSSEGEDAGAQRSRETTSNAPERESPSTSGKFAFITVEPFSPPASASSPTTERRRAANSSDASSLKYTDYVPPSSQHDSRTGQYRI